MSKLSNSAKFAIIPAHDGTGQIVKYSTEYIDKVLNNMKAKHTQEVEETYYFKQVLGFTDIRFVCGHVMWMFRSRQCHLVE